jgi:hypothetical protein
VGPDPLTDWLVVEALVLAHECADLDAQEELAREERNKRAVDDALERVKKGVR